MSEKPIIFSTPMVQAILLDLKTQTRRVLNPQPFGRIRETPFSKSGLEDTYMHRIRFDNARKAAINEALANNDNDLAELISKFQFRDTRPKAASDMNDIDLASKLLGHTKEEITRKIYIRRGQEVTPFEPQNNE